MAARATTGPSRRMRPRTRRTRFMRDLRTPDPGTDWRRPTPPRGARSRPPPAVCQPLLICGLRAPDRWWVCSECRTHRRVDHVACRTPTEGAGCQSAELEISSGRKVAVAVIITGRSEVRTDRMAGFAGLAALGDDHRPAKQGQHRARGAARRADRQPRDGEPRAVAPGHAPRPSAGPGSSRTSTRSIPAQPPREPAGRVPDAAPCMRP
jgi:hypothetical protein